MSGGVYSGRGLLEEEGGSAGASEGLELPDGRTRNAGKERELDVADLRREMERERYGESLGGLTTDLVLGDNAGADDVDGLISGLMTAGHVHV